tara:strand:+ start:52 stop:492 length:441 start_codon:yes stop_codon:yes gene_type:complete
MKKYLIYIIISFFYFNFSNAGLEGYGEVKLNPTVLKYFKEYLDTKIIQNKTMGSERHGKGWFFFIEENGEEFGYTYCPQGKTCTLEPGLAKNICIKNIKKYLKRKGKCKMFAKQRTIVWDNKKIKIPTKASETELESILRNNGFIN